MYLGRIYYPVVTLGYGNRIGIWFCGCNRNCKGCISPEFKNVYKKSYVTFEYVKEKMKNIIKDADGVTISGGEPFEQVKELRKMIEWFINSGLDDILIYTGFSVSELKEKNDKDIEYCLSHIAALIDGTYIEELNKGKGLMGSDNQNIYIYKYFERYKKSRIVERRQQCIKLDDRIIFIGIPKEK